MRTKNCSCLEVKEEDWQLSYHNWNRRAFYQERHKHIFHQPIGIEKAISEGLIGIENKGFTLKKDGMILDEEIGRITARTLIEIEEIPFDPDVHIIEAGKIYSNFHHGPFREMKSKIDELLKFYKQEEKREPKRFFTWTTNCPKCWEDMGGPIVVLFAK